MSELSPEARKLLAALLDVATFQHEQHQPADQGHVYTLDAFPAAEDVPRSAWVELVALTGEPDDAYAANGARLGRVIGWAGDVPIIDADG